MSRATFYRQFRNRTDVWQRLYQDLAYGTITEIGNGVSWRQGLLALLNNLAENRDLMCAVASSPDGAALYEAMRRTRAESLAGALDKADLSAGVDETELRFQADTLSRAESHLLLRWLATKMPDDVDDFAAVLESVAPPLLYRHCESVARRGMPGIKEGSCSTR